MAALSAMKLPCRIRAAMACDMPALGEITCAGWRDAFVGLLPDRVLLAMQPTMQAAMHAARFSEPEVIYRVAEGPGGQVLGFAGGGPARGSGFGAGSEVYTLYLRPEVIGMGLGRALFTDMAGRLLTSGREGLVAVALAGSPGGGFYIHLGGQEREAPEVQLGGLRLPQTAYLWETVPA